MLNYYLPKYSMLNKPEKKLGGKSIALKIVPGIVGLGLFPSQELHVRRPTLVLFQTHHLPVG